MRTTVAEQRRKTKRILLKRSGYQFGQPPATCSMATRIIPGDVACADTSIQMAARILKGKFYSINYIRRLSGNQARVPMNVGNAVLALRRLGLDYQIRSDLSAKQLMIIARTKGPVLIAEDYWAHPQWKDYNYGGIIMKGTARNSRGRKVWVGFSDPVGKSGNNQPVFRDGHMVLLATSQLFDGRNEGYIRDPNHNSSARPQRPAWDRVNVRQLGRMLRSFNGGRNVVAIVPERKLWK